MRTFLSAIVLRNGDLLCDPEHTDSHEDLIQAYGLKDDGSPLASRSFCRVEFIPPEDAKKISDLSRWSLRVDGGATPAWYEEDVVRANLEARVQRMFMLDNRNLLLGGCWILAEKAKIDRGVNIRIVSLHDSSQVGELCGSSQVGALYDSSRVGELYGSSRVGELHDSSQVGELYGSSQVGELYDSSQVGELHGSSRIIVLHDSSQVGELYDSSRVGVLYDSSRVGVLYGSSRVGVLHDSSQVGVLYDSSQVGELYDSSQVVKDLRSNPRAK